MKKLLTILALCLVIGVSYSQTHVYRLKVKHNDMQFIYMLLRGTTTFNSSPEISTWYRGNGGFGNDGFGKGG